MIHADQLFAAFNKLRIAVIGDVMLDHYLFGEASRISPEAPVPIVRETSHQYMPGGAGNVAANLGRLGVKTQLLGLYGEDEAGQRLQHSLAESGIDLCAEGMQKEYDTIVKTRVVAMRQQLCRIDREPAIDGEPLSSCMDDAILEELVSNADAVILSDYAKGALDNALIERLREAASRGPNKPLLVMDPKPAHRLDISGMDVLTPNLQEAAQLVGMPFNDRLVKSPNELGELYSALHENFHPGMGLITMGANGMLLGEKGKILEHLKAEAKEVFDVSGAGDTVVAVLAAGLCAGLSFPEAAKWANTAAGIVVGHLGATPVSAAELNPETAVK